MKKHIVYGIQFDTDGEKIELPERLEIEVPDNVEADELEDYLSDEISNITGFCHTGFLIEGVD